MTRHGGAIWRDGELYEGASVRAWGIGPGLQAGKVTRYERPAERDTTR
jgi:hypothetical protein